MAWIRENDLFGGNFGFSIDAQRIDRTLFVIVTSAAVENEVGGEKDHGDVICQFAENARDLNVEFMGQSGIALTLRTPAQRGTMKDGVWLLMAEEFANSRCIGQVEFRTHQWTNLPSGSIFRGDADQIVTDETSTARYPG